MDLWDIPAVHEWPWMVRWDYCALAVWSAHHAFKILKFVWSLMFLNKPDDSLGFASRDLFDLFENRPKNQHIIP